MKRETETKKVKNIPFSGQKFNTKKVLLTAEGNKYQLKGYVFNYFQIFVDLILTIETI